MKFLNIILLFLTFFLFSCESFERIDDKQSTFEDSEKYKWQQIDEVWAVVSGQPVLRSEVEYRYSLMVKSKKISKRRPDYEKSRILDTLIYNIILEDKALEEGIIVSDEKVDNEINEIMKKMGYKSLEKFKNYIERKEKVPFELYKDDFRMSIISNYLMIYVVDFKRPSEKEAKAFYRKQIRKDNRPFLQVRIKVIRMRPKNKSFQEEKKVNAKLNDIRKQITSKKISFESAARKHSDDRSSSGNGGDLGWKLLSELDPYLAGYTYQKLKKRNTISEVVKLNNDYYIIKYIGKKVAPFDEFKNQIFNIIASEKSKDAMQVWLENQKMIIDVKISMKKYANRRGR